MRHTINEWQDFSLKKDVENIAREIKRKEKREHILTVDVFLATLAIVLDHAFSTDSCEKRVVFWIIGGLIVLFTLCYIATKIWDGHKTKKIIKSKMFKVKQYVDLFDNHICYYAMTASTFRENFQVEPSNNDIKNFYFIETNYYVNKCISELTKMENLMEIIFTNDAKESVTSTKIHTSRLDNIILILRNARIRLSEIPISIEETVKISKIYDEHMEEFIKSYNKKFNKSLEWLSCE